jgi:lactocepin
VSFNSEGGSALKSVQVDNGNLINAPINPIKTGYTFGGWYKNEIYSTKWNFATNKVTANLTLFAKWIKNPAIPQNVKLTATYNSIRASWNPVLGVSGYEVWRSTGSAGNYSLVSTTTATSFKNTNLTTGSTYNYKVRAYITVGSVKAYSLFSPIISSKTTLGAPMNFKTIKLSKTSIKSSWNAVSGASGYEIYKLSYSGGPYRLVKTTTSLSFTNFGLSKGRTYYYKVRAYRTVGTAKVYSNFSAVMKIKL